MAFHNDDEYCDPIFSIIRIEMERSDKFYHSKNQPEWLAKFDLFIGQVGALNYIIDKYGNKLTSGYHRLYDKNLTVYGESGASTYPIGCLYDIEKAAKFIQQKKSAIQLEGNEQ